MDISIKTSQIKSELLVFTSAGDNSNLRHWVGEDKEFDLWVSYYGDTPEQHKDVADYYCQRKGGKFPAVHFAYKKWPALLSQYKAIMVMDDDIIIDAQDINRLFKIHLNYNLWVSQPGFNRRGKISYPITQASPLTKLRYTSFVEMTCPIFRVDKLLNFLDAYDPKLVGWGADWWFIHSLGENIEGKVAVIDEVTCINPHNLSKGGTREIDQLQDSDARRKIWLEMEKEHNITSGQRGVVEYSRVRKKFSFMLVFGYLKYVSINTVYIALKLLRGLVKPWF